MSSGPVLDVSIYVIHTSAYLKSSRCVIFRLCVSNIRNVVFCATMTRVVDGKFSPEGPKSNVHFLAIT